MSIMTQVIPGISGTEEYVILFILAAAGSTVLVGLLFKQIRRLGSYAYANARARAMKGRLLMGDELKPFEQSQNLQNLVSLLKDSPYSDGMKEIKEAVAKKIEMSLRLHLAMSRAKITNLAPEGIREVFMEMEKIHEIENLKSLLIAKYRGESPEETKRRLLPIEFIPEDSYDQALEAENLEGAIAAFEGTEYWGLFEGIRTEIEEDENLLPLWYGLEKKYWVETWKTARDSDAKYSDILQDVVGKKIDIKNILTLLRCKAEDVEPEETERYLIPIHTELESEDLERATEAESLEEALAALEDTPFEEPISGVRSEFEDARSVRVVERALNEFILRKIRTLSIQESTGVGPLVSLFYEKEAEVNYLMTIVNGKEEGLEPEKIEKTLVTPGGR